MTPAPGAARSVLVVGGGLAGFHVAHALRRQGCTGEVTVLGAEPHLPYDRPPLSKAFLLGTLQPADLALDDAVDPLDVTWCPGTTAVRLLPGVPGDRGPGVRTSTGEEVRADAVVLATGADAITLGALGPTTPGVHVLRTLDDAVRMREDHPAGRHVVVVGMGFVGLEAASVAVALGAASVTVIGPEHAPLDRLGAEVGRAVQALHERHGVRFHTDTPVTDVQTGADGRATGVATSRGVVPADVVIVGVGARAATGWLADTPGLPLAPAGEVRCDDAGHTGLDGVWALGDCARWGERPTGHWQDALDQAAVVAADVVGAEALPLPAPYFWSDQHGVRLQLAGHLLGDEQVVVRAGSADTADLLVAYERDGVQSAVLALDRPRDVMRWRRQQRTSTPESAGSLTR